MRIAYKIPFVASVLLLGGGCADLDVTNPNEPNRGQALTTAGDIESLVASSYRTWYESVFSDEYSPTLWLSNAAFEHSSMAANFGQLQYGNLPKLPILNDQTDKDYAYVAGTWYLNYRSLSAISQGLRSIEENDDIRDGIQDPQRLEAFARFVQGLAHGTVALLYDRGYVVDENDEVVSETGVGDVGELLEYDELMAAALGFLDQAIELSRDADFTIPASWIGEDVPADRLARMASSLKARYRANVARTAAERQAVDWQGVLTDLEGGLDYAAGEEWLFDYYQFGTGTWNIFPTTFYQAYYHAWQQGNYMILGMADTSGLYQEWLRQPVSSRTPQLAEGEWFLIQTPDARFPSGQTIAEQQEDPGAHWVIRSSYQAQFSRPDRGTWRWSLYWNQTGWPAVAIQPLPMISTHEMRLLAAEAHYRLGDTDEAAVLVNVTRTTFGLDPAPANDSCVPRLPSGECGDLFEMLKWEKRMMTWGSTFWGASWFFDGRGWDDLYEGTPLHLPIPSEEIVVLAIDGGTVYTFGGVGGEMAAEGSSYCWPGEGEDSAACLGATP